ncbi:hypothetical protein SADUNF_Sadunf15G0117300 [Salix dunnii]|uniref:Uncharacterized protein n=1 Tax=Salix dunnii TaxID=1413687 RepID=A0A835JGK7_9ROSI|nr:hypothetical protein SADUNF_Sadunf15G0117300 [Salix dunnii]
MRTAYSPLLPLLLFSTIMLSLLHPSSCRHISRATYEEKHQLNTEFSSPLPQHKPAIAHTMKFNKDDKVKNLYAASHKLVPGNVIWQHFISPSWKTTPYIMHILLFSQTKNILLLSIPTIHVMGNKNSQMFLIFLIEFLVLVHGTSCRDTKRSTSSRETEHSLMFLQPLYSIFKASESSTNKINAVHTVSRRFVPGGPDPHFTSPFFHL